MPGVFKIPGFRAHIGKRAVAVVVKQNVLAALQAGRTAGDQESFVRHGPDSGRGAVLGSKSM